LGVPSEAPVIAVIGYLAAIKRQDDAIRALARVRESHPETQLVIAGGTRFASASAREANTVYARNLRALAAQLDLQNSIHFVGERADVREVLAITDVLLVPSLAEGFGRVVLEAMAMAVPVIATSVGGPSEIITDGLDGFLLEPDNPELWGARTASLLADPERRRAVGERARERASRDFTPSAFRAAILGAYRRALSRAQWHES
jgi:glycosyltransferase involved in cell wall biosynthesis